MLARIVNCMAPMGELLRLTDSKPSLGNAYSALMGLRGNITHADCKLSNNRSEAKTCAKDVRQIVDRRIDFITTPIYKAAYPLNPRYRAPEFP